MQLASLQLPKYESAVCKVLFSLTRSQRNDSLFFVGGGHAEKEDGGVAPPAVELMLSLLEIQSKQVGISLCTHVVDGFVTAVAMGLGRWWPHGGYCAAWKQSVGHCTHRGPSSALRGAQAPVCE